MKRNWNSGNGRIHAYNEMRWFYEIGDYSYIKLILYERFKAKRIIMKMQIRLCDSRIDQRRIIYFSIDVLFFIIAMCKLSVQPGRALLW